LAKNFCCVTTRYRNLDRLGWLRQRCGTLTARPLGLGVLGFDRFVLTPFGLPLRRLPAPQQTQAFGILAITLIPTPRLVLLSTSLAQTNSRPRSAATAVWLIMTLAHGSALSQGTARGGALTSSSGAYRNPEAHSRANLFFQAGTRQRRKQLEKGAAKETKTRQRRKRFEKGVAKETIKNTIHPGALQTLTSGALFLLGISEYAAGDGTLKEPPQRAGAQAQPADLVRAPDTESAPATAPCVAVAAKDPPRPESLSRGVAVVIAA
jgi:hypothetical protein